MRNRWQPDVMVDGIQDGEPVTWHLPEEAPVALIYNRITYAVMMTTPADLEDFAYGFSLTERLIDQPEELTGFDIHERAQGIELHMTLSDRCRERLQIMVGRSITGRSGCGLCGIDSLDRLFSPLPAVAGQVPDADTVAKAVAAMKNRQPLKALNRSVHGAAWIMQDGTVSEVREDVGRHNALDKLLGSRARAGADNSAGFVLMTSRASYELVDKCTRMGVAVLVTLSAPTAFAVRRAREAGLTLANYHGGQLTVFG